MNELAMILRPYVKDERRKSTLTSKEKNLNHIKILCKPFYALSYVHYLKKTNSI